MAGFADRKGRKILANSGRWAWTALIPAALAVILWLTDTVRPAFLLMETPVVKHLPFLESSRTYAYLHFFTFIPVFLLSFDRNVHYYKKWKYLFPAILAVGAFFIVWDIFFTIKGVWGFNQKYYLNVSILHLPIEEWLFFFTVPFACVFIYECLNFYIKKDLLAPYEKGITLVLIVVFLSTGIVFWGRLYTSTTFLLGGSFLLFHRLSMPVCNYRSRFYLAFIVSLIPFLFINGILTGGYTRQPIVVYNPEEYLGVRITSIPLDDAVYGFLLLFGVLTLYEYFKERNWKNVKKIMILRNYFS